MDNTVTQHLMRSLNNSRGVAAVLVALMMTVLLAMAAATIDIGHAVVARNELQNAADAGALAGARTLGIVYQSMPTAAMPTYTLTGGDRAAIVAAAQATGVLNAAAGVNVTVDAADIQIGLWNSATRTLTPTVNQPRAVRVITRRDGTANGPVSTFLASVVGMTSLNVTAVATAEMTAVGKTAPGQLNAPFGISQSYFTQSGCGNVIKFHPNDGTPEACAAWNTFDQTPANANTLKNIINGMINGTYQAPATELGYSLNLTNGNVASAFPPLINLYNAKKDASGNWDVFVSVYQGNNCSAPSGVNPIVGYSTARITSVLGAPQFIILATIQCNVFDGNSGGGIPYGTFATIPGLVE